MHRSLRLLSALIVLALALAGGLGPVGLARAQTATPADIIKNAITPDPQSTGSQDGGDQNAETGAQGADNGATNDTAAQDAAPAAAKATLPPAVVDPALKSTLDAAQRRVDTWTSQLDRTEASLQRNTITTQRLDELRATVIDVQSKANELQASLKPRAQSLERRVAELAPPEGSEETLAEAVAKQLEDQRAQLAGINGVLKQIQVSQLRAEELLTRIIQMRRDQLTRRLLTPTPSILEPRFWSRVANDLPQSVQSAGLLISDWFGLIYARAGGWAVLLVAIALVGTYGLIWPVRRLLLDRAARDPEISPAALRRSTAALVIVVLSTVVPVAAMIIFYRGLDLFDLAPNRIKAVMAAVFGGATFASFAQGLAWALIAPTRGNWRLLPIADDAASQIMKLATAAGITFAVGIIVSGTLDVLSAPTDLILALQCVVSVTLAILTMMGLRAIARSSDPEAETIEGGGISSVGRWLLPLFWLAAIAALIAPLVGYIRFASFMTQQIVWTVSVFGVLHLLLMVVDDVATGLFRAETGLGRTLRESMALGSGTIEQIGVLLSGILRILLIVMAVIAVLAPWGISTGDVTGLARQALFGFQIGSFTFSLSQIVLALLIFVIGLTITRAMQRWLETRYLPHTRLDVGLKSSIRTGFGYVGVIIAGMIAFSYLGLNLQNIAIVAGALSVGIGFGLQSIVNNFVSGLILLAERPIKVGDWIVVGEAQGYVRRINVRATEVETFDRQTVIVPNSDLISGVVKNWMHDDTSGRIILGVGVSYSSDPEQVRDILQQIARENSDLLAYPAPVVYFMDFGASSLDFELRAYLAQIDYSLSVKSDLRFEIMRRFREAGIEIPFPQRDLNIRDFDRLETALRGRPVEQAPARPASDTAAHHDSPAEADGDVL